MADTGSPAPTADRPREPWGSWSTLFQHSSDAIFLLSRRRQLRYVNRAWENRTGKSFETLRGAFCLPRKKKGVGPLRALLQTLSPPPEVLEGRIATVARPVPPARLGPPWWEITFVPLLKAVSALGDGTGSPVPSPSAGTTLSDGLEITGYLGFIQARDVDKPTETSGSLSEALMGLRQQTAGRFNFDLLTSELPVMQRVETRARLAAALQVPLWIAGEEGTGKETLARIIHFNGTQRDLTFLGIDGAALQPVLIRNMLFGSGGQADAKLGTIYLKDPTALDRDLQAELVEWYGEQEHPPRLIAGCCRTLDEATRSGQLLEELGLVFGALEINLLPLRDRLEELPALLARFMIRESGVRSSIPEIAPEILNMLGKHSWPGNFRELATVLREAIANGGTRLEPGQLPLYLRVPAAAPSDRLLPKLDEVLESVEMRMIRMTLKKAKGNKTEAADLLGIPRGRLLRRMEALKIDEQG